MVKKSQQTNRNHAKSLPELKPLSAKTDNQSEILKQFKAGKNLVIHGLAGTGKTFIACSMALNEVFKGRADRMVIYRSAVPTRDMGFMPGTRAEKEAPYEDPYRSVFSELFERGDAFDLMKKSGLVDFSTTSYLRGLTIKNTVVIVDECQNMSFHELDSLITRLGTGSRIIFCGDYTQSDLTKHIDKEGLHAFLKILRSMSEFAFVEMRVDDIIRSDIVKSYIISKSLAGY